MLLGHQCSSLQSVKRDGSFYPPKKQCFAFLFNHKINYTIRKKFYLCDYCDVIVEYTYYTFFPKPSYEPINDTQHLLEDGIHLHNDFSTSLMTVECQCNPKLKRNFSIHTFISAWRLHIDTKNNEIN